MSSVPVYSLITTTEGKLLTTVEDKPIQVYDIYYITVVLRSLFKGMFRGMFDPK